MTKTTGNPADGAGYIFNQNCKQNSFNQFLVYYVFKVGFKIDIIMCKVKYITSVTLP